MAIEGQSFFPISELSTYQTKWTIRARITNIAPLRTFSKGGGTGKVFSLDLLDAEGGEIRATFFNAAVDNYYEKLQKSKCYTFSSGTVRIANRQFNACNHRYEIVFDRDAQVVEVADVAQIETIKFSFTDLRTVQSRPLPSSFDLCGIIISFRPPYSFTSREGKELVKREITIADDTATSMNVTLWGDRAKQDDKVFEGTPLVCLKGVSVKEWNNGRSGSLMENGELLFQSTMAEAQKVQQWWLKGGATQQLTALSTQGGGMSSRAVSGKMVTLSEMRTAIEHITNQEVYNVICRPSLVMTKKQGEVLPLHYVSCQEPKEGNGLPCNRRVDESGFCGACNRAGKAAPRFTIRVLFADFADKAWLTTFHEGAQRVLGMEAEKARSIEVDEGREALEAMLRKRYFQQPYQVTVRAKPDTFNGEPKTNITCIDARPVSCEEHGRMMLKEIHSMLEGASTRAAGA